METIFNFLLDHPIILSFVCFYGMLNLIENVIGGPARSQTTKLIGLTVAWIGSAVIISTILYFLEGHSFILLFVGALAYCLVPALIFLVIGFLTKD